jgi:hypothetical protein
MILKTLICLFLVSGIANADFCSEELLLSTSWKHERSGDIYTLRNGGKLSCFNEKRHRNECDYVYMSDFQGVPHSWKLVSEKVVNITFKKGLFSKETVAYSCEYVPDDKLLKVGRIVLVPSGHPKN